MHFYAQEYSKALGRTITYHDISVEPWQDDLVKRGLPVHLVNHLATMADLHRAGLRPDVGRRAYIDRARAAECAEFVRKNAATFTARRHERRECLRPNEKLEESMSTASTPSPIRRESALAGQTVVVIGGSAGIGLETARLARTEGAKLILAARTPEPLERAASQLGALSSAAFDATDFERLAKFFDELPTPIHHVLVTGPGPYYAPLAEIDFEKARRHVETHLLLPTHVARNAIGKVRPGGTLLFMGGTGGRRTAKGYALISSLTAALPAHEKSRARARADSCQPDRCRLC
jgi:hypothetical protein